MNCGGVRRQLSEFVDLRLTASERREMERHLAECASCSGSLRQMEQIRHALRISSRRRVPEYLTTTLKVIASRERSRRLRRMSIRAALLDWWDSFRFAAGNVIRPLAIPVTGGVCSAVILFSMMAPYFAFPKVSLDDIPTMLYRPASLRSIMPFRDPGGEIVLEVEVNEEGRVVDYTVTRGAHLMLDQSLRRAIENNLLFTQFYPSTAFGQPVRSKLLVRFERADRIDVIG